MLLALKHLNRKARRELKLQFYVNFRANGSHAIVTYILYKPDPLILKMNTVLSFEIHSTIT